MRRLAFFVAFLFAGLSCANAQWEIEESHTTVSLRGIHSSILASVQAGDAATIQITVLNAKNGRRVEGQTVGVAIKGEKSQAQYVTDAEGNITLEINSSAEIYVRTDWWITCHAVRPMTVPFVSVERVVKEGSSMRTLADGRRVNQSGER